jgi:cell division septation protein DedD
MSSTHQRGVYQPLMENVPLYDLSDEELEEEEHSRLPLLIIIALLVLAAFAGVVWLAYNQGVARGRASAQVVIAAQPGPVRTAPTDAGGTTPYQGLKVYDQPISPQQEAQASTLAPAPKETLPQAASAKAPTTRETPPARLNPDNAKVAAVSPKPAAPAGVSAAASSAKPAAQVAAPAVAAAPAAKPAAQSAAPAPRPAITSAQTATGTGSAVSGAAVLQIGAYESPEIANGAWNSFRTRFSAVAGGLAQDVQKADLGAKGTWYRLRVGPFADKASAAAACEKLRAQGGTCFVAAP